MSSRFKACRFDKVSRRCTLRSLLAVAALAVAVQANTLAMATESATGVYLLGSKGSMAGVTPPPGTYLQDFKYYYSGSISGALDLSGVLAVDVKAQAYYELPTVLWIAPQKVLGGNVGFGVIAPVGWKDVRASAQLNLPPPLGIALQANLQSDDTAFGDPLATALIGWRFDNWHWNLSGLLNVPVGFWQRGNPSNIGFNRWAADVTAAVTRLDPKIGWEVSAAAGVTFNFDDNPATDYNSGDELHVEFAVVKTVTKDLGIGITGFHYEQLNGDSGAGARLGPFKGRVTGIGPVINCNFTLGKTPVRTSLRWLHELDVKNRLEGDAGLLTITVPLSGAMR
jgi:hypothetical protein